MLTLPCSPPYARVARTTSAALGALQGFTVEVVDDLRLLVTRSSWCCTTSVSTRWRCTSCRRTVRSPWTWQPRVRCQPAGPRRDWRSPARVAEVIAADVRFDLDAERPSFSALVTGADDPGQPNGGYGRSRNIAEPVHGAAGRDREAAVAEALEDLGATWCAPASLPTMPTTATLSHSTGRPSSSSGMTAGAHGCALAIRVPTLHDRPRPRARRRRHGGTRPFVCPVQRLPHGRRAALRRRHDRARRARGERVARPGHVRRAGGAVRRRRPGAWRRSPSPSSPSGRRAS